MPRKSKKSSELEPAAAHDGILIEPIEADAPAKVTPKKPAEKPARKTRARKSAAPAPAADETSIAASDAEAGAQAADTFDDAIEANDAREASAAASEPEPPKKKTRSRKAKAAAEPEPKPEVVGPDEDAELEGDWESGSGSEDDEEEEEHGSVPRPPAKLERLQKILAAAGIASRRHAEELIVEGRVQVNGKVVTTLGSKADAGRDHIRVDGKLLHGAERLRYFVLNKPRGYVTTVSDPEGRPTVMEFFSKMGERLYPVGRLDYLSEGLLLMTNDGELANKLTRAASGVEKTYLVKVSGQPDEDLVDQIRQGISIDRGRPGEGRVTTAPAHIQLVRVGDNPWYEVGLIEGRNRELRKMFEEIGHHVEKIRRIGYGPLVLDQEPGNFRELDAEELRVLRLAAEGKWKPKRIKSAAMLPPHSGRSAERESGGRQARPFRARDDRRPPQRTGSTGERREDSRPSYGRTQERGSFERQARPQQGRFAGGGERPPRTEQPPRREQPRRTEYPPREGGFADRRGAGSRPRREFPRRPEGESDRGARGGNAPRSGTFGAQSRPGGFPARREGGSREGGFRPAASREGGFKDQRQGAFDARRGGGGGNPFSGPRGAGKPAENRGGGQDRPRFSGGGERREGGQGDRFRPRPAGSAEGGFAPRPGGRTREQGSGTAGERGGPRQGGERPQGRPAFGRGNFGGPPRGGSAGPRGPASRPTGGGQGRSGEARGGQSNTGEFRTGQPRSGGAGAGRPSGSRPSGPRPSGSRPSSPGRPGGGQFKRSGSAGGPPRGAGSRRPPAGPRRGGPSQGRSNSSRPNSGRKPGSRPSR